MRAVGATVGLFFLFVLPVSVAAEDDTDTDDGWVPGFLTYLDLTGRGVVSSGSETKFREDYNRASGVDIGLGMGQEWKDGLFSFEGLGYPVEGHGYGGYARGGIDQLEWMSLDVETQRWVEFYNTRSGTGPDFDAFNPLTGAPIMPSLTSMFPNTDDGRAVFPGGQPDTAWLMADALAEIHLPVLDDLFVGFGYRSVEGEMSLLKGGTVGVADPLNPGELLTVDGSGPGSVFFAFPGFKQVDYQTLSGIAGTRTDQLGINWELDASAAFYKLDSRVMEANFGSDATAAGGSELDIYVQDTKVEVWNGTLSGARHLHHDLYMYGSTQVKYDRSDPEPSQTVQSGIAGSISSSVVTRNTLSSKIERWSSGGNVGAVYSGLSNTLISTDLRYRYTTQSGDLIENRDEQFGIGDRFVATNSSDRDTLSVTARTAADWRINRNLSLKGDLRYDYRNDDVDSSRIFAGTPSPVAELEDYETDRSRVRVGLSSRYRFRGGRRVELGYRFLYEDSSTDVALLQNQFLAGDLERLQNKVYLRAWGRIMDKLRGELRFHYIFEQRDLSAPFSELAVPGSGPVLNTGDGEVDFQAFELTEKLTYQPSEHWNFFLTSTVGQQAWSLESGSVAANMERFSSFEYDALTFTAKTGGTFIPSEAWSTGLSYTVFFTAGSVETLGHNVYLSGGLRLTDDWRLHAGVRYMGFRNDIASVDDYDAAIFTAGMSGVF